MTPTLGHDSLARPIGRVVAVIPARGGSKRVVGKNLRMLAGEPLVAHSIRHARDAGIEAVVSTDDPAIAAVGRLFGATVLDRPPELATDTASSDDVLLHAAEHHPADTLLMLQPTSPCRGAESVREALRLIVTADSVVGVVRDPGALFTWQLDARGLYGRRSYTDRPRTQEINLYRETGAMYAVRREVLMSRKNRIGGRVALLVMSQWGSIDIDDEDDLALAEWVLTRRAA